MRMCYLVVAAPLLAGCSQTAPQQPASPTFRNLEVTQPVSHRTETNADAPAPVAEVGDPNGKFAFADDLGGKLLAELLPPRDPSPTGPPVPVRPLVRAVPSSVIAPVPPTPVGESLPPTLRLKAIADIAPRLPAEVVPDRLALVAPELPVRSAMPEGVAASQPNHDLEQPVAVPRLAARSADRASLLDPTDEFSAGSAVGAPLPLRSTPAPFAVIDLPNPFENAEVVKMRGTVTVDPVVALSAVPSPRP